MEPALAPVVISDIHGLRLVQDFLQRVSVFGMDTETNMTDDWYERKIRTIQIGNREEQYIIDLLGFAQTEEGLIASQGDYGASTALLLGPVIETIRPAFENHDILKVGFNLQFDYEVLRWNLGIRSTGFWDCMRAEQNLYAGTVPFTQKDFWGMEHMVARYLGLQLLDLETGKTFDLSSPLTETQITYSALDVRLPIPTMKNQQLTIADKGGLGDAVEIDCDAISAFGDMRLWGFGLADEKWQALIDENLRRKARVIAQLDKKFIPVVGTKFVSDADTERLIALEDEWRDCPQKTPQDKQRRKDLRIAYMSFRSRLNDRVKLAKKCEGDAAINYGSRDQLIAAFRLMGYTKRKMPDTADPTLEGLAKYPNLTVEKAFEEGHLDYPVIDLLRLFRSIDKQLSTYGDDWLKTKEEGGHRHRVTGRIHSNINLLGAATGRTTSSSPNIQNIPKEKRFRHCFTARPGYRILTVDYSSCELRILAFLSQEPVWIDALAKDEDLHSIGAEMLFGQEWIDATEEGCDYYAKKEKCKCKAHKKLRDRVKALNFGLAYGLTASGLAGQLDISEDDAQKLIDRYAAAFPTVWNYLQQVGDIAKSTLCVRSLEGGYRLWQKPDWGVAKYRAIQDEQERAKKDERPVRPVTPSDIDRKYRQMFRSIEREGKNAGIQRFNAYLTKRAMFLIWQKLYEFGAGFCNMVHDELVIECPEETADACLAFVSSQMTEAGKKYVHGILMTVEPNNELYWTK